MVVVGVVNFSHVIEVRMNGTNFSANLLIRNYRRRASSHSRGNNRTKDKLDLIEFNYIKRK